METRERFNEQLKIILWMTFLTVISSVAFAQINESSGDKTLSPYFFVRSSDPELDKLPLKSTSADVNIAGVIANVLIEQVYKNEGKKALEAIYVFPASTRAAVYSMKMTIGERTIIAKIKGKQQARQDYEEARQNGQTASLLEQQRPNVFQMNVANIMPGDIIKVAMAYTELLVPDEGIYEFSYPTVVGPRYSEQPAALASASEKWIENPYTQAGEKPFYTFDLTASIKTGIPIKDITCTSHDVNVSYDGPASAMIKLKETEKFDGNRDYILKYRLRGHKVESGLLLYEGEKENFFLLMVQPPKRVIPDQIPPREYIFIVDVSGSMHGFPLGISKELLRDLIGKLRPTDVFNVILFAGTATQMAEKSIPATSANISKAINVIDKQRGGGGTRLLPALQRALNLPGIEDVSRSIVIATDGYVSVEKEAFDLIRKNLGRANFFSFGIGSSVNRYIIEGMAHVGMGEPFVLTNGSEAKENAVKFRKYIESPVLTNITLDFGGLDVYDVEPLSIPDVLAERPVIVFGKYNGSAEGKITLKGMTGSDEYLKTINVGSVKPQKTNEALRNLWARHRIKILDDYNHLRADAELIEEITQIGLEYNLLTAYTSFIAIDSKVRGDGSVTTVKQPLPLPQGVSNHAIGGNAYPTQSYKTPNLKMIQSDRNSYRTQSSGAGGYNVEILEDSEVTKQAAEPLKASEVDVAPSFVGGTQKMQEFIKKNLRYPMGARSKGIEGTVVVSFTVGKDGKITGIKVIRKVGKELDAEAIRIIKLMPSWKAGLHKGQKVAVRYTIPIQFKL